MVSTVITSTIGRPELRRCIESVRSQKDELRHMVYVNGPKYHESAREILKDYPRVSAFYLPEETGDYGRGCSMADVFAAAPFLTRADWIFYLDDDNFFDPNHIESLITLARRHDLGWAYSLRRFVDQNGTPICDDDWDSLGHDLYVPGAEHLVDNSCYAVSRRLAQKKAIAWTALPIVADRCFARALMESGARYGSTGISTVNYRIGGTFKFTPENYLQTAAIAKRAYPNGFPWRKEQVFG